LRPHDFAEPENQEDTGEHSIWELPDISILFKRYLDSGKMINVYDWFESFQLVLETQRKHVKKDLAIDQRSPTKKSDKRKGKGGQVQLAVGEGEGDGASWKMEVQARFIRALQEMDYLGFIKHTGRKADHVQRTVFDMPD
jgi:origin recognition complex subunit 3